MPDNYFLCFSVLIYVGNSALLVFGANLHQCGETQYKKALLFLAGL